MAALKTISAALKLIDTKKENLKKAYDDLQAHSSLLSSFPVTWSELDSHFTAIQNSLVQRFNALESLESQQNDLQLAAHVDRQQTQNPKDPCSSSSQLTQNPEDPSSSSLNPPNQNVNDLTSPSLPLAHATLNDPSSSSNPPNPIRLNLAAPNVSSNLVSPRDELKGLCEKMDGKGLRNYVSDNLKDRNALHAELPGALRLASDPAAMVLDSLDGFIGVKSMNDADLRRMRRGCLLLLEQLRIISPVIGIEVREKAKKLGAEWKANLMNDSAKSLEALGFLHLMATYGLVSECSMDELVEFSALTANNEEVPELCRLIGLIDKVPDLIEKLMAKGKHVLAVKYIFEFNLADKIPPVPILKACVSESRKLAKRICHEGKNSPKSLAEAEAREIHALKSVIKVIDSHKLDHEYPRANLEQRIQQLEKQKVNRKRSAPASSAKSQSQYLPQPQSQLQLKQKNQKHNQNLKQYQRQQQIGKKRPRTSALGGPSAVHKNVGIVNPTFHQYQQSHVQPTGLLPEHPNSYMTSPAMPYGMVGPTPTISPYAAPPSGSLAGVPVEFNVHPGHASSHLYSSEPHVQSGYYDRIHPYGGYGLQQYYQAAYYPQ